MNLALIGPPNVGKTTAGALLAARLGLVHHELDRLRRAYFEEIGFDMELNLALSRGQGMEAVYQYWKVFDPHAIERFIGACAGVLDFGGGTPVTEHPLLGERVTRAFSALDHTVLLLPAPDLEESMEILGSRSPADVLPLSRYLISQGSLQALATHTVYVGNDPPEVVVEAILAGVGAPAER